MSHVSTIYSLHYNHREWSHMCMFHKAIHIKCIKKCLVYECAYLFSRAMSKSHQTEMIYVKKSRCQHCITSTLRLCITGSGKNIQQPVILHVHHVLYLLTPISASSPRPSHSSSPWFCWQPIAPPRAPNTAWPVLDGFSPGSSGCLSAAGPWPGVGSRPETPQRSTWGWNGSRRLEPAGRPEGCGLLRCRWRCRSGCWFWPSDW